MADMERRGTTATAPGATATWSAVPTRRLRPPVPAGAAVHAAWRTRATAHLTDLLAIPLGREDGTITTPIDHGSDQPQLVTVATADGDIPCWLILPPADRRLGAAVVAIAGHGSGIDNLVAISPSAEDFHGGLAHKLAAVGFTVLCPEMISFGRRRTPLTATTTPTGAATTQNSCQIDGMRGLLTGRPVLGRRVADTLAAVRALRAPGAVADLGIDPTAISIVGGSGGGAVALLAAAVDDTVSAAVVGAFLSSFDASFCAIPHCLCNAVPELLTAFEMADIAALVAPRRLIVEAGRRDPIFPITATESTYAELVEVWNGIGAHPPDLVITDAGHQFLADDAIALLRSHATRTP